MSTLSDPTKPAGHLVEVYDDGGALRNDGVKLKPASQNPWYVLATVYGEQSDKVDWELAKKNQRIWNAWACMGKSEDDRVGLAEKIRCPVEELAELTAEEEIALRDAFADRLPQTVGVPKTEAEIDMSKICFPRTVIVQRYVFPQATEFKYAVFQGGDAVFNAAAFIGDANFHSTRFSKDAYFGFASFEKDASFDFAEFDRCAGFVFAAFSEFATFLYATFSGGAKFNSTKFSSIASFQNANFGGPADFSNGTFSNQTAFGDTKFHGAVPKFYHRTMHQDTEFSINPDDWPTPKNDTAEDSKRAYTRLHQIMKELNDLDGEHFFFRQQMRCKLLIEDKWWNKLMIRFYGGLSSYGYSVALPAVWLAGVVGVGWGIIGSHLRYGVPTPLNASIWEGLGVSISNTFPFLGFHRKWHSGFFDDTHALIDILSGTQSVLGIILLFFLGLGLRNRFRIK